MKKKSENAFGNKTWGSSPCFMSIGFLALKPPSHNYIIKYISVNFSVKFLFKISLIFAKNQNIQRILLWQYSFFYGIRLFSLKAIFLMQCSMKHYFQNNHMILRTENCQFLSALN